MCVRMRILTGVIMFYMTLHYVICGCGYRCGYGCGPVYFSHDACLLVLISVNIDWSSGLTEVCALWSIWIIPKCIAKCFFLIGSFKIMMLRDPETYFLCNSYFSPKGRGIDYFQSFILVNISFDFIWLSISKILNRVLPILLSTVGFGSGSVVNRWIIFHLMKVLMMVIFHMGSGVSFSKNPIRYVGFQ